MKAMLKYMSIQPVISFINIILTMCFNPISALNNKFEIKISCQKKY